MARAIQPFSTFDHGDTLFAVSTGEVHSDKADQVPELIDIDTVASETMWDAILASVPREDEFVPLTTAVEVAPDLLARYVGHYRFGPNAVMMVTWGGGDLGTMRSRTSMNDMVEDR
jgi:hypothetical protein